MNKFIQLTIWDVLQEEIAAPDTPVEIKGAVNLKAHPICDYKVSLAYGDLALIIAMIRDYIRGLDQMYEDGDIRINPIEYDAYYRKKFMGIADRISEQINYDYDKKLAKCLKKLEKGSADSNDDIGGEALILALKHQKPPAKPNQEQKEDKKMEKNENEQRTETGKT